MIKEFIALEWKAFFRSASFQTNLALKILMFLGAFMMILYLGGAGVGLYFFLEKADMPPLQTVNTFLISVDPV